MKALSKRLLRGLQRVAVFAAIAVAGCGGGGDDSTDAQQTASTRSHALAVGTSVQIKTNAGFCLDASSPAAVVQQVCNGSSAAQVFDNATTPGRFVQGGNCLGASASANGTQLSMMACNNAATAWTTPSGTLMHTASSKCADIPGAQSGVAGTKAQIWSCDSSSEQQFTTPTVAPIAPPQWVDTSGLPLTGAALPGFPAAAYSIGDSAVVDLGLTVGALTTVNYQCLRDGSPTGMPSGSAVVSVSYAFVAADAGHNVSCVMTPLNAAGAGRPVTLASVAVVGGVGGVLSGTLNALADNTSGTAYNLATEGANDWAAWTASAFGAPNKRSGGPSRITAQVLGGSEVNGNAGHYVQYVTWAGGTPTASYTGDGAELVAMPSGGAPAWLRLTVTGVDTTQRRFQFWGLVLPGEPYTITASLSDGSAATYTYSGTGPPGWNIRFDLDFKAASAGQTLTIDIKKTGGTGYLYAQAGAIK